MMRLLQELGAGASLGVHTGFVSLFGLADGSDIWLRLGETNPPGGFPRVNDITVTEQPIPEPTMGS